VVVKHVASRYALPRATPVRVAAPPTASAPTPAPADDSEPQFPCFAGPPLGHRRAVSTPTSSALAPAGPASARRASAALSARRPAPSAAALSARRPAPAASSFSSLSSSARRPAALALSARRPVATPAAAAAAAAAAPASAPAEPAAEAAAKEFFKLRTLLLQQCVLSARAHEAFAAQRGEAIAAISDVWSQTERRCAELARRRGELRARRERILAARAAAAACSDGLSARIEAALQRLPSNHASLMHGLRASLFALPCEGVRVDGAELAARLRACGESLAALLRAAASLEQPAAEAAARVEALSEAVDRGAAAATRTAETLRAAAALETLERSLRAHLVQLAESE
jgi:hypothetical protein